MVITTIKNPLVKLGFIITKPVFIILSTKVEAANALDRKPANVIPTWMVDKKQEKEIILNENQRVN